MTTLDRRTLIHCARAQHAQLRARMHDPAWRDFWWALFGWAQDKRRAAAEQPSPVAGKRKVRP